MKNKFFLVAFNFLQFFLHSTQSCSFGETSVGSNCICELPMILFNNECTYECPTTYYLDRRSQTCLQCPFGCEICNSDAQSCLKCFMGFNLVNGICTCFESGFIFQSSPPCTDTYPMIYNGETTCIKCLSSCPSGYFYDATEHRCSSCHSTCASCTGPSSTECLICANNLALNPYTKLCMSSCLMFMTPDSEDFCVPNTCAGVVNFFDLGTSTCSAACTSDTVYIEYSKKFCGTCDGSCDGECYKENDAGSCKACDKTNNALLNALAFTDSGIIEKYQCDAGVANLKFSDNYNSYVSCFPYCKTCTNTPEVCTSCSNSSYYLTDYGYCLPSCPGPTLEIEIVNNVKYCHYNRNSFTPELMTISTGLYKATSLLMPLIQFASQLWSPGISSVVMRFPYLNMYIYLRYLKINFPLNLFIHFGGIEPIYNAIPSSLPDSWAELSSEYHPPARYERYKMKGLFLTNFWPFFSTLIIISIFTIIFVVIKTIKGRAIHSEKPQRRKFIEKYQDFFVWNYLLSYFFYMIFPGSFMMMVEYQTLKSDMNSYCILSLVANIVFLLFTIVFTCRKLIPAYQEAYQVFVNKKQIDPKKSIDRFKFLYEDFVLKNVVTQYFLILVQIRLIFFAIFLTLLSEKPMFQTGIFVIFNILMIIIIQHQKPFKSKRKHYEVLLYELLSLTINIMTFLLAFFDTKDYDLSDERNFAFHSKESLSSGILFCDILLCAFMLIFSFVELIYIRKAWKVKNAKAKVVQNLEPPKKDSIVEPEPEPESEPEPIKTLEDTQIVKSTVNETLEMSNLNDSVTPVLSIKREIPRKVVRKTEWVERATRNSPAVQFDLP